MPDPQDNLEYPNRPEELKDMEMKPVVLGPGSYGSPDPSTEAARLLPLNEHPLKDSLSPDFGSDVANADTGAPEDLDELTVEELDEQYGDEEGYPKSGVKADKVKFAKKAEKE
jgi:hypothetical protein